MTETSMCTRAYVTLCVCRRYIQLSATCAIDVYLMESDGNPAVSAMERHVVNQTNYDSFGG